MSKEKVEGKKKSAKPVKVEFTTHEGKHVSFMAKRKG